MALVNILMAAVNVEFLFLGVGGWGGFRSRESYFL